MSEDVKPTAEAPKMEAAKPATPAPSVNMAMVKSLLTKPVKKAGISIGVLFGVIGLAAAWMSYSLNFVAVILSIVGGFGIFAFGYAFSYSQSYKEDKISENIKHILAVSVIAGLISGVLIGVGSALRLSAIYNSINTSYGSLLSGFGYGPQFGDFVRAFFDGFFMTGLVSTVIGFVAGALVYIYVKNVTLPAPVPQFLDKVKAYFNK